MKINQLPQMKSNESEKLPIKNGVFSPRTKQSIFQKSEI